jgi:uncharacterized integral membrane protein
VNDRNPLPGVSDKRAQIVKEQSAPKKRTARNAWLVLGALAGLLLAIAIAQNSQVIVLRFLFWESQVSQILVIGVAGLLGFLVGVGIARVRGRSRKMTP